MLRVPTSSRRYGHIRELGKRLVEMKGEYQHGIFCSGSQLPPRTPGNTCSCYACDLYYNRLNVILHDGDQAKRTLRVAACPGCHKRTEFPYTSEATPREVFCVECKLWA